MHEKPITLILGFVVAAALVGSGVTALTNQAQAGSDVDGMTLLGVEELTGESESGEVESIVVSVKGSVNWDNLPSDVQYVDVAMEADVRSDSDVWEEITSERFFGAPSDTSGSFNFGSVRGDVIQSTSVTAEAFSAGNNGETESSRFPVRVVITVQMENGETIEKTKQHQVKIEVTNIEDDGGNANVNVNQQFSAELEVREDDPDRNPDGNK